MECEYSDVGIDLKLLPDNMPFEDNPSSLLFDLSDKEMYNPYQFSNSALQQSKVNPILDETDPDPTVVLQRKFRAHELEGMGLQQHLASENTGEEDRDALPVAGPAAKQSDMEDDQFQRYRVRLNGL